ncbi:uncharacterized protein JCM6883_005491 [Sporobolomyces salmoneus]|uniref:uncharacterized protein n=1 Tax=Sporobolomyces salmoneus TaxID=183962 RepID=UPI00316B2FB1
MEPSGLQQLRSIHARLGELIDAYAQSESKEPLYSLDQVGEEVSLEPQDSHLAAMSGAINQMQAVVLGDKLPFHRAMEYHVISCTNVAIDAHIEESLREAWDQGTKSLTVEELAKPTGIDASKLARCLRLLASYHIFIETEPNSFARNRCSAALYSGASVEDLIKDPLKKYQSLQGGFAAMVGHFAQEGMRAASYQSESLLNSTGGRDYGFSRAFDGQKIWEYFAREENEGKRKRFQCGFLALSKYLDREESVLLGFPWSTLPEGSTVCDIAGRTGNVSLEIAQAVPHLNFVVQDQESIIKSLTIPFWEAPERESYKKRFEVLAHDFFDPQPIKNAAVYLIRMALHGFNDDEVVKVLSNLSEVASPSSKLVIIEAAYESLAGPDAYPPPSTAPYLLDMQMLSIINVRERLEEQYVSIARKAGWKHAKTWKTGSNGKDGVFRHYEFELA